MSTRLEAITRPCTTRHAWSQAVIWFGAGDLLTSTIGITTGLARESSPYIAGFVADFGVAGLIIAKAAGFAVGYVGWRLVPSPYDHAVPITLAVLGLYLTLWNSYVLYSAARLL